MPKEQVSAPSKVEFSGFTYWLLVSIAVALIGISFTLVRIAEALEKVRP